MEEHLKEPIRYIRQITEKEYAFACITGYQLYVWMKDNQYCGRCGHETVSYTVERAQYCPKCHNIIYPRINPAVIAAVINDHDELLLTRYAGGSYKNYALIAGFTEIGETIEETVKREVREETGLIVDDIRYFNCQPWSFSSTLLFGFTARAHGSQQVVMDEKELGETRWISRDETDLEPQDMTSLTALMIHTYLHGGFKQ